MNEVRPSNDRRRRRSADLRERQQRIHRPYRIVHLLDEALRGRAIGPDQHRDAALEVAGQPEDARVMARRQEEHRRRRLIDAVVADRFGDADDLIPGATAVANPFSKCGCADPIARARSSRTRLPRRADRTCRSR